MTSISANTLIYTEIGLNRAETLRDFKIDFFLNVFMKMSIRNTYLSWFCKLAFKYPYFHEIWNPHHRLNNNVIYSVHKLDPKYPSRDTTRIFPSFPF